MEQRSLSHSNIQQSEVHLRSNSVKAASQLHEHAGRGNSDGNVFCIQDQLLGMSAPRKLKSKSQASLIQLLLQVASLALHGLVLYNLTHSSSVLMDIMLLQCYIYSVRINVPRANARGNTSDGYNSAGRRWLRCLARVHPAW